MQRFNPSRRRLLGGALAGFGAGACASFVSPAAFAAATDEQRILVVLELSGGNDGLNTVVPHGDDAYYRHRPTIGLRADGLRPIDDHFGLNPGMVGFERLWQEGDLAIVHGCGYDNPSFSHFTSMAYWHTAAPNSGAEYGWVGRLADGMDRCHARAVKDLACRVLPKAVEIRIIAPHFSEMEEAVTLKKSDLFEETFKKTIVIQRAPQNDRKK